MGKRIWGSGFRVQGLEFRVQSLGYGMQVKAQDLWTHSTGVGI
jgi:hypothetical protein